MTFKKVNISDIADGTYVGECNINIISAKVEVTVKSGKILNINLLEHKNERGKKQKKLLIKYLTSKK
ncbi:MULTISPECIES: hypothetical protein [unclassified Clostridioides]|uniref:hypothetical protein n=1 Tax=unclassified Clostridioides TaxID=2635829 RepID=UPI001D0F8E81